jgi:hypothetical protein
MGNGQDRPAVAKQGVRGAGLDATPTGSVNVTIADFTGAADVALATSPLLPVADWITRTDSQTLGSSWVISKPGLYLVKFIVAATGANRVQAGILRGSQAAPANPVWSEARILGCSDYLQAAAQFDTKTITAELYIANGDIDADNNVIRFMLTNAAGAAAPTAGLVLASCGFSFSKGVPVHSLR